MLLVPVWPDMRPDVVAGRVATLTERIERLVCLGIAIDDDPAPAERLMAALAGSGVDARTWTPHGDLAEILSAEASS